MGVWYINELDKILGGRNDWKTGDITGDTAETAEEN